ncbi:MAG: hypothetical protein ACM4AI_23120 [Acidobacteriota bacterium]
MRFARRIWHLILSRRIDRDLAQEIEKVQRRQRRASSALPFHDPDRLVAVWIANPKLTVHEAGTSYPTFADWRPQSQTFADMACVTAAAARITGVAEPERDAAPSADVPSER